ncbi:hypothetical protein C3L33_11357, partial [Rhododendron williamsianum]
MAERLRLPSSMSSLGSAAASRLLPLATKTRLSLSTPSPPSSLSSSSSSSLKCLRSTPLLSHLFLRQVLLSLSLSLAQQTHTIKLWLVFRFSLS